MGNRDPDTQLALLDRIAGTAAAAAAFGGQLRQLWELEAQLAAIDALGDEDERDALQALVDEVCGFPCLCPAEHEGDGPPFPWMLQH